MTHYFDQKHHLIQEAEKLTFPANVQRLREIEESVVFDVSVCIMCEGFPADLQKRANQVILDHAVDCRPCNALDNPNAETVGDHFKQIHELVYDLHTVFHDVVTNEVAGHFEGKLFNFTDDPRSPLRQLATRAEALREEMVNS